MKKLTIGFCAAMILLAGVVITACRDEEEGFGGSTSTEVADRIASLETQVASLQRSISSLTAASEAADASLREELEKTKTALETAKAELQKEIDAVAGTADFDGLAERVKALESAVPANYNELSAKIKQVSDKLDGNLDSNLDTTEVQVMLDELKAEFDGAIAAADTKITACETAIDFLEKAVERMQTVVDGKVDTSDYEDFVQQTNKDMQDNLEALSVLQSLCAGFEKGEKIKEYIDEAVGDVATQLGVLQETYATFVEEYGTFKTEIDAKVASNTTELNALKSLIEDLDTIDGKVGIGDLLKVEERIALLNSRVDSLKNNDLTLKQVEEQFNKSNTAFLNGVNGIITDALGEGGLITAAIADKAAALQADYQKQIDDLSARVGVLEGKVDALEGKADAMLKRIQSLVYVPKTTDGKIHIGMSYIAEIGADGSESGPRMEVATTKKLEYRVSPAGLRDSLLLLYQVDKDAFSFWQEHVSREHESEVKAAGILRTYMANTATRAAEPREGHDGLHEFNILKLEPGNSAGTLLITVDNEHDFTHEDLAVALCIRHEDTKTGVLTEYSTAYTPVVGEGTNLINRFYLAKKDENGNYTKVSRTDRIDYTLIYSDRTPITLLGDYEVVYDNGETVMSLEDAKAKYEWDAELTGNTFRTKIGGTGTNGNFEGCYGITPNPNTVNLNTSLTFALTNSCTESNLGNSWYCKVYGAKIVNKKGTAVTIISDIMVQVTVVPAQYKVTAEVKWNSDKFYEGKNKNWTTESSIYTTSPATLTYSQGGQDLQAGNLPGSIYKNLFADGHPWNLTNPCDSLRTEKLSVTSKVINGNQLAFDVQGFVWCEDKHNISMARIGGNKIPTSGKDSISVIGTLNFVGPSAKDLVLKLGESDGDGDDYKQPIEMSTNSKTGYEGVGNGSPYALLYMAVTKEFMAKKYIPLNREFFPNGNILNASYTQVKVDSVACVKQPSGNGGGSVPDTLKLEYYTKPGGRPSPMLRSINVKDPEDAPKISSINEETTYKTSTPIKIAVADGPTIQIYVTFKFVPEKID